MTPEPEPSWEKAQSDIHEFCRCIGFVPMNDMQRDALTEANEGQRQIDIFGDRRTGKTAVSCVIVAWFLFRKGSQRAMILAPVLSMSRGNWQDTLRRLIPKDGYYWTHATGIREQLRFGSTSKIETVLGFLDNSVLCVDGADGMDKDFVLIPTWECVIRIYQGGR